MLGRTGCFRILLMSMYCSTLGMRACVLSAYAFVILYLVLLILESKTALAEQLTKISVLIQTLTCDR